MPGDGNCLIALTIERALNAQSWAAKVLYATKSWPKGPTLYAGCTLPAPTIRQAPCQAASSATLLNAKMFFVFPLGEGNELDVNDDFSLDCVLPFNG